MSNLMKPVAGIMLVGALAVGLGGCSSSDDEKVSTPVETTVEAEESATPTPEVEDEDVAEGDAASERASLDAYVEAEKAALESADPEQLAMYSDISIEGVDPGTVVFTYVYADALDAAATAAQLDTMAADLQEICDTQVFPAMTRMGVVSPTVVYTYNNADGSEIWSQTFEPS